ncbi:uncharacterized protein LOC141812342 [Curcuma longa]|uniref:uncharacterized protein LOC141812342 n=1 Tax=Curcuma longa TaxID=136217 RepID=UPI003D9F25CA
MDDGAQPIRHSLPSSRGHQSAGIADFLAEAHQGEAEEEWKAYVDGAANKQGSGVGVVLVSPKGEEIRLAVRLGFRASNNEAEYEAVLMGLQAARRQVEGNYEIKNDRLRRYAEAFAKLKMEFKEVKLNKIPRGENSKADELARAWRAQLLEWTEEKPITQVAWIAQIDQPPKTIDPDDWRKPILTFLQTGGVPGDPEQARLLKRRATRFTLIGEQLRTIPGPEDPLSWLLWPTLQADAAKLVSTCLHCQKYQPFQRQPTQQLKTATTSCPFDQWGMDIVGPFPIGPQRKKFLLVAVKYFSKWVEAEALARITEEGVLKFLWKNIVCRYGIPQRLVSDNGRQFQGRKIQEWCKGLGIQQAFTSVAYPQSNGQTEVVNREIVRGLKTKLDHEGGSWVEELPCVLWAYRTTPKESTGLTPFHLVYGGEAVVPMEVGVESDRRQHYGADNDGKRLMELDLISETRDQAAARFDRLPTAHVQYLQSASHPSSLSSGRLSLEEGQARRRSRRQA